MPADIPRRERRRFLRAAITAMLAAIGGAMSLMLAAFSAARNPSPAPTWVPVAPAAELPEGSFRMLRVAARQRQGWFEHQVEEVVYARRLASGEPLVLSAICTHLGCAVRWVPEAGEFHCPCHGGIYGDDGAVRGGPPPAPLRRYPTRVAAGTVEIRRG